MTEVETLIIGAGITGIALARELSLRGHRGIMVIDKERGVAHHTSGRNSGVLHAGYNQKPGTRKAALCVAGNRLIKDYCRKWNLPLREDGILIVARAPSEVSRLEELLRRGQENGVPDLHLLDALDIASVEPNAVGVAALHAKSGAAVDGRALVQSLAAEATEAGVNIRLGAGVEEIDRKDGGFEVRHGSERLHCRRLVNCAGLQADHIAHRLDAGRGLSIIPVRGEYRLIRPERAHLVRSMIYPVPDLAFPFLGVHWTRTTSGAVKIGPNAVPALGREAYSWGDSSLSGALELARDPGAWRCLFRPGFARLIARETWGSLSDRSFLNAARTLVPAVALDDLLPGPAGIRAQLVDRSGTLVDDLLIEEKDGAIHVLNVVSPGITCSLAFARDLADQVECTA